MIITVHRQKKRESLLQQYPGAILIDVTSKAEDTWVQLSPFYPHGDIPIPFTEPSQTATSVEGIWQGLKVFEYAGIDHDVLHNKTMQGIKRSVRHFGEPLGHQRGLDSEELLDYMTARREIYLPCYRWMLEHKAMPLIEHLRVMSQTGKTIVLLDYNISEDVDDPSQALSHAYLVKAYAEGLYPYEDALGLEQVVRNPNTAL